MLTTVRGIGPEPLEVPKLEKKLVNDGRIVDLEVRLRLLLRLPPAGIGGCRDGQHRDGGKQNGENALHRFLARTAKPKTAMAKTGHNSPQSASHRSVIPAASAGMVKPAACAGLTGMRCICPL
ncbi:hypothetical protein [Rhodopseudomonas sp. RCAM05734]|uniref:hypothetical protein n=1 Tax=Rhodopseudomonas sp. RCAM05734 TaxID=3457549 RepID=UPI004045123B